MAAVATAYALTLDEVLASSLEALAAGAGGCCVVCGDRAVAIRERDGTTTHLCRGCGSSLEEVPGDDVLQDWDFD
jgi:hypothetical protein